MTDPHTDPHVLTAELVQSTFDRLLAAPVYRVQPIILPPGVTVRDLVDALRAEADPPVTEAG